MTRRSAPQADPGSPKASRASAGTVKRAKTTGAKPTPAKKPRAARSGGSSGPRVRVIAVANQKGGVGKSTTAVSLGAALAELGHRVLVVDLDPQGNASTGLGIRHEARDVTVYDVLAAEAPIEGAIVPTPVAGLFAIPSTIDLAGAEIELVSQFSRELRLRRALEPLQHGEYDFVFLDCPPSLGLLTVNALAAARELIVPIQCEYYALEGLGQLLRNVRLVQQNVNPNLHLTGIVMTMYDPRTKLSEQVVEEVRRHFGDRVYDAVIPRTVRLSEAPGFGQPITVYDPRSRGAECYRELAKEVASKLPKDEPLPSFDELPTVVVAPPQPEPMQAPRPLRREDEPREPEDLATRVAEEAEAVVGHVLEATPEPSLVSPAVTQDLQAEVETAGAAGLTATPAEPEPEPSLEAEPRLESEAGPPAREEEPEPHGYPEVVPEVEVAPPVVGPEVSGLAPAEPAPEPELPARGPDADGAEEWIAALEAEGRAEAEVEPAPVRAATVREIDLGSEDEATEEVESGALIRIEDRDAAGVHEPRDEGSPKEAEDGSSRRRWGLFRRGGSR